MIALLLASVLSMAAAPDTPPRHATTCLARWELDRSGSVLGEHRSLGVPVPDFSTSWDAEQPDPATWQPVRAVERFQVGGTPLLWFTPDNGRVVVHAGHLSPLTAADPTRMSAGTSTTIGQLRTPGALPPRDLVELLVRSQVILTYWHIGATLCLVEEVAEPAYRARFEAVHEYYTNEENHDAYGFTFVLEADGRMRVEAP